MRRRPLGRSGLSTAPLVFDGNVFGWTADEATSHRLLDAFVDGGFNAVDTADVYSAWVPGHEGGESESVIGRWLKASGKRDKVLILTKVAMWPKQPGLSAANIEAAVEGSSQASADRLHRPLPVAPGRRRDADRRDAGGLRPPGEGRQGAGDRRVQLLA
jgi:aryl-alcohol dehydrogenase-like predicted oxidoreductase